MLYNYYYNIIFASKCHRARCGDVWIRSERVSRQNVFRIILYLLDNVENIVSAIRSVGRSVLSSKTDTRRHNNNKITQGLNAQLGNFTFVFYYNDHRKTVFNTVILCYFNNTIHSVVAETSLLTYFLNVHLSPEDSNVT